MLFRSKYQMRTAYGSDRNDGGAGTCGCGAGTCGCGAASGCCGLGGSGAGGGASGVLSPAILLALKFAFRKVLRGEDSFDEV